MSNQQAVTRALINEAITPEEERAYMTWWAARPPEEAIAMREYGAAVRIVFRSFHRCMERKMDPAQPEVQALVDQWNEIALRYRLRNTMTALLGWNASIARKWLDVGENALSRAASSGASVENQGVWGYFKAAVEASGWHRALVKIADEAAILVERKAEASGAPAKALIERLARTCAEHSLGDPAIYAQWSAAMQRDDISTVVDATRKMAWVFLATAALASP